MDDRILLARGDRLIGEAIRCWAGLMSDEAIAARLAEHTPCEPPFHYDTAAVAVARHCAHCGVPARQIIAALGFLAAHLPGWPDEAECAAIATAAVREAAT